MLTITPTRINPVRRLGMALKARYLRWLIRCAERDLQHQDEKAALAKRELELIPQQKAITRAHIGRLRVRLADCE